MKNTVLSLFFSILSLTLLNAEENDGTEIPMNEMKVQK